MPLYGHIAYKKVHSKPLTKMLYGSMCSYLMSSLNPSIYMNHQKNIFNRGWDFKGTNTRDSSSSSQAQVKQLYRYTGLYHIYIYSRTNSKFTMDAKPQCE